MAGVLIVEDDADLREMLRDALEKRKFTVITAANGREAIARFRPSVIDLVVTDLLMPEEDGLMVIMKIRELKPSVKMIAISGGGKAGPGSYLLMASTLGADHVFSKPFLPSELLQKVREILA
ncbi:MAG: response regulator [Bacteroidales bacterium]|nr:response regulator [Bacteroidales bacterium]MDT8374959.1 response regulator [Bacteroidales bacterium]